MNKPKELRIIIFGGRHFNDRDNLYRHCDYLIKKWALASINKPTITILNGACGSGADWWAQKYAKLRGYHVEKYPADWQSFGRSAGPLRNKQMAELATHAIGFWDGKSRGTESMIDEAKRCNLTLEVISYE